MGYQRQTTAEIRANLAEQLDWHFAERDDSLIAQALVSGAGVDRVHPLDEAGLLDGFFAFLQETKVLNHWQSFQLEAVQRVFLPGIVLVLLYGVRLLFGIGSTNALPQLLFSNVAVMSLIGFTAYQVAHGLSGRSAAARTKANGYVLMDPQTLAETISQASAEELARLFNGTIHCLAAFGVFMAEVMIAVDGTPVVTPATYAGCGCQRKKHTRRNRAGVEVKEVQIVFGWRLIVLIDLVTLIPLALKIVRIQSHEAPYLLELVRQAQHNLAPYSRIRWLVVDRAYVDGPSLYALHELGIKFVVIAKTNMKIYATACRLSQHAPHPRTGRNPFPRTRQPGLDRASGQPGQSRDRPARLGRLSTPHTAGETFSSARPPGPQCRGRPAVAQSNPGRRGQGLSDQPERDQSLAGGRCL